MAVKRARPRRKSAESIGERLARFRQVRGITQAELARQLGINQSHVSHYERGHLRLHGELIAEACRILRVSSDELLGLRPEKSDEVDGVRRLPKLMRRIAQLPQRDQRSVLRIVDGLLARYPAASTAHARG